MNYSSDLYVDEPLKSKLLRNGFRLYFLNFLIAPAGYIIKMLASHQLAVADLGVLYSIIGLVAILSTYNDLGLTESLQYFLPHYLIDKEYKKAKSLLILTRGVQFLTGVLIGGCLYIIAPRLAEHYFHAPHASNILRIFSIYFLLVNLFQVLQSIFIATQKVIYYHGIEAMRMWAIVILLTCVFFTTGITSEHFAWSRIIGLLFALVCALFFFWKQFGWLMTKFPIERDKKIMTSQWKYAILVMLGMNVANILGQVDQQFAVYFLGGEYAGYWSNVLALQTMFTFFTLPGVAYLFPLLNELEKKGEKAKIKLLNHYITYGVIAFSIIAGIIGVLYGPNIAIFFFGSKFLLSGHLFQYIAPFLILNILGSINFQRLAAVGKVKQRVYVLAFALAITIVANYIGIQYMGIYGLIVGTIMSRMTLFVGSHYYIKKTQTT